MKHPEPPDFGRKAARPVLAFVRRGRPPSAPVNPAVLELVEQLRRLYDRDPSKFMVLAEVVNLSLARAAREWKRADGAS